MWAKRSNKKNLVEQEKHVGEDSEGVLPATAGATAWPLGALCCSVVGNGLGELLLPDGVSWPETVHKLS